MNNPAEERSFKSDAIIPQPMTKTMDQILGRDFYARSSVEVARAMLGREIVRRFKDTEVRGYVMEVSAWEGHTKTSSDGLLYAPGTIGVSTKFGNHLLDIATEAYGVHSCVTLIAAQFHWGNRTQLVDSPGKVARALRVDRTLDGLKIFENDTGLSIVGGRIPEQDIKKREKKNLPANCKGYFYITEVRKAE
jgi:3-methyladenine DNA glycosylase Mpg